jgi:hypothetical protein
VYIHVRCRAPLQAHHPLTYSPILLSYHTSPSPTNKQHLTINSGKTSYTGLMYTFDIGTGVGKWLGYQILRGIAVRLGFQLALNIAQADTKMEDIASVTAAIYCRLSRAPSKPETNSAPAFQTTGAAFAISAAQSGFVNRMITALAKTAPSVSSHMVIGTGATQI